MKKMFMMAAAGVLAVSLTACGGNQKSATESVNAGAEKTEAQKTEASQEKKETEGKAEEKHMTMTWWGNQVRNERTEAALDLYSEENPGVTFDSQPAEWNDYWTKLSTLAAGNSLPECLQMDYSYLAQYVACLLYTSSVEELMEIPEMNERTAEEIVAFFASQTGQPVVH